MPMYEHENASMWTLSNCISRYHTTIEGAYNITYNIGIYNIITTIIIEGFYNIHTYNIGVYICI